MRNEQIEELLPFYALGVLTEAEQQQVEAYAAEHPEVRQQLEVEALALASLAYDAPPLEPSAAVKEQLLSRIRDTEPVEPASSPQPSAPSPVARRGWSWPTFGPLLPALAALSLLAAILAGVWVAILNNEMAQLRQTVTTMNEQMPPLQEEIAALRAENEALAAEMAGQQTQLADFSRDIDTLQETTLSLDQKLSTQAQTVETIDTTLADMPQQATAISALRQELTSQTEMLAALQEEIATLRLENNSLRRQLTAQRRIITQATAPDAQIRSITGTEALPTAQGQLVANPDDDTAALIISGLPPLAPDQIYQFWFVQNDAYVKAGRLDVDETGIGTLIVDVDDAIGSFQAMGVSIETEGIEPQPTRESMIMLGSLSS